MIRAALAALVLVAAAASFARADDFGPRRAIRELRGAVPLLVHARLDTIRPGDEAVVDAIVVGHDSAIANWHGAGGRGISVLRYRNATWWLQGSAYEVRDSDTWLWTYDASTAEPGCILSVFVAEVPVAAVLRRELHADEATTALWAEHTPKMDSRSPNPNITVGTPGYRYCSGPVTGRDPAGVSLFNADGYRATWTSSSAGWKASLISSSSRAPTDAEMSGPGANSIVYIYATGSRTATAFSKSTLTIWCPFVLDTDVHYIIEFSGADGRLGPIRGTLNDNTLTFEIPAFTAPANADLRGEVDYLPYREH